MTPSPAFSAAPATHPPSPPAPRPPTASPAAPPTAAPTTALVSAEPHDRMLVAIPPLATREAAQLAALASSPPILPLEPAGLDENQRAASDVVDGLNVTQGWPCYAGPMFVPTGG